MSTGPCPEPPLDAEVVFPHTDPCPRCGRAPELEHDPRHGFRYRCPVCTDRIYPYNRTLAGATLDWNTQQYRGSLV